MQTLGRGHHLCRQASRVCHTAFSSSRSALGCRVGGFSATSTISYNFLHGGVHCLDHSQLSYFRLCLTSSGYFRCSGTPVSTTIFFIGRDNQWLIARLRDTATLFPNLCSENAPLRTSTASLLYAWLQEDDRAACEKILDVEQVALNFSDARERCMKIRRLAPFAKTSTSEVSRILIVQYLTGRCSLSDLPRCGL